MAVTIGRVIQVSTIGTITGIENLLSRLALKIVVMARQKARGKRQE
jgi:hypothetical protein